MTISKYKKLLPLSSIYRMVKYDNFPVPMYQLQHMVYKAWKDVWKTKIGGRTNLVDLNPTGQIIGLLFESLLSDIMCENAPTKWRRHITKVDKDIVYIPDEKYSIEVKTSGQKGFNVYGNKSYAESDVKSNKEAYYLIVNYYQKDIKKVRFGLLNHTHWTPQKSKSGQQAKLNKEGHAQLIDITETQDVQHLFKKLSIEKSQFSL